MTVQPESLPSISGADQPPPASLEHGEPQNGRPGRPRSDRAHRDIREAFREILIEEGYAALRLEHVAARAHVGKATIYRHWGSKQALAQDVLSELASPHISVPDVGDTWSELLWTVRSALRAVTDTDFGRVIRALLSEIASDPTLGDPFRATVVQARRVEVARVLARGVQRGDLRPDVDPEVATELLIGPVYFRLMFGGALDREFAERVVRAVLQGFAARP
jgi:AcrR family transcriptional regulator